MANPNPRLWGGLQQTRRLFAVGFQAALLYITFTSITASKLIVISIRRLSTFTSEHQKALGNTGYTSYYSYQVDKTIGVNTLVISIQRYKLEKPYIKRWPVDQATIAHYHKVVAQGYSWASFDQNSLVGVMIVEKREWNNSFWIDYIEVVESYQGRGIGSQLVAKLVGEAQKEHVRIITLETQNTNGDAIDFYQRNGFEIDGLNTTLYDSEHGEEIAIFLSKQIEFFHK
ncbi:GNAT family N-acetyltransferase [Spirosoma sp. HMF4905]|uniref:GNAT family N-acetyltransferase n=1 Tax=Spirosoma arboris TaxID=2682092 RepID=A0A7K1SEC1_9BACT|nr:GNAT family N-acetyltransferase [Spirosoma arboris]MVM32139.1 GNAT family N-acetyltransferase [Spirosoma arboris]